MNAFLVDNLFPILGLLVTVISVFLAVRMGLKQVIRDVAELKVKTELKDELHDRILSDHETRISVMESKLDQVIRNVEKQLTRIYDKLFNGK